MIRLRDLIKEEEVVKNKKTGNVYVVQKADPKKHDKPSPAEIEKTKQANNGVLPKSEPQPKQTPQNTAPQKPKQGQKLSGLDFKSSAETPKDSGMPKLKDLMPGMDTSAKSLSQITPIERQKISTIVDKLAELGRQAKEKGEKHLTSISVRFQFQAPTYIAMVTKELKEVICHNSKEHLNRVHQLINFQKMKVEKQIPKSFSNKC